MSTHTHTSALALWVLKLCCSCHTVRIRMVTVWEQHRPVPVQFPELAFRRALWTTGKCRKKMLSCTSHIITTDTNTHSRCYWHFFAVLNHVIVHRNVQWECSMRMFNENVSVHALQLFACDIRSSWCFNKFYWTFQATIWAGVIHREWRARVLCVFEPVFWYTFYLSDAACSISQWQNFTEMI